MVITLDLSEIRQHKRFGNVYKVTANKNTMRKTIEVQLEKKILKVSTLPIGKYALLLKQIKELPKHLSDIDTVNMDQLIQKIPFLIATALPDVIGIVVVATDLEQKEAENCSLEEITDIVIAIVDVNNFIGIFEKAKKALALPSSQKTS